MYKYSLLAISIFLAFPGFASAQSDENVTKRRPDRPAQVEVQEIRQESRTQFQANQDGSVAQRVAENHSARLSKRFKFYEERLNSIVDRFQVRIDLLKQEGKAVSSVQAKLDLVIAKLEEAMLKAEEVTSAFNAIESGTLSEQKQALNSARDLATEARKLFQETHELLKLALKELKTISKPALPAASPAVQNAL